MHVADCEYLSIGAVSPPVEAGSMGGRMLRWRVCNVLRMESIAWFVALLCCVRTVTVFSDSLSLWQTTLSSASSSRILPLFFRLHDVSQLGSGTSGKHFQGSLTSNYAGSHDRWLFFGTRAQGPCRRLSLRLGRFQPSWLCLTRRVLSISSLIVRLRKPRDYSPHHAARKFHPEWRARIHAEPQHKLALPRKLVRY